MFIYSPIHSCTYLFIYTRFVQGADKAWMENEPKRIPYLSKFVDASHKEEKTQVMFIIAATIFVVIVIGLIFEVYRSNRAHRKRIERETDESIIFSKEQAAKFQESQSANFHSKPFDYSPVSIYTLLVF